MLRIKRAAAVAALSLGTMGLALALAQSWWHRDTGPSVLVEALGGRRLIEPRLTGGFPYQPCRPASSTPEGDLVPTPECSPLPAAGSDELQALLRAINRIRSAAEQDRSPRSLLAESLTYLLARLEGALGGSRGRGNYGLEQAMMRLERAAAEAPDDAWVLNTLAATSFVRAQLDDEPQDLAYALEAVTAALRADPELPEALFNRALTLESLALETAARAAWLAYLETDTESGWAEEAQARLQTLGRTRTAETWPAQQPLLEHGSARGDQRLVSEIVRHHRQSAREHVERTLLGAWADALVAGDRERADRLLRLGHDIGRALRETGGERLLSEAVGAIDEAVARGNDKVVSALAKGHRAFRDGYARYKGDPPDYVTAAAELATAHQALERGGSCFAGWAALFEACCVYFENRYRRSYEILGEIEASLAGHPGSSLSGHVHWMKALLEGTLGRPLESARSYDRAARAFAQIGEEENAGTMEGLLAEALQYLGQEREAWRHIYRALRLVSGMSDPGNRSITFSLASDLARKEGRLTAALAFQDEAVRQAAGARNPALLADTLFWRAFLQSRLGRPEQAGTDVERARRALDRVQESELRTRILADLARVEAEMSLATDPRAAIDRLDTALGLYQEIEHRVLALQAHLLRARAHRLAGDAAAAEGDFRAALAAYESLGEGVAPKEVAFLSEADQAFDEMIAFQVDERHDGARAFAYADRARTRVLPRAAALLDSEEERRNLLALEPEPSTSGEIERRLPDGTSLVQYVVLEDRLLLWHLRHGSPPWFRIQHVRRQELESLAAQVQSDGRKGGRAWARVSSRLFELLVAPLLPRLRPDELLVFVPDKSLHGVPFAALRDPGTRRYLVQDHPIVVAPSATLYVEAIHRSRLVRRPEDPMRAFVLGDPAFDRELLGTLRRLPGAAAEATGVAGLYPGTVPLTGPAATKQALLALAPGTEMIHLAAHGVANGRDPLSSLLALAPSAGDSGVLYAREIYQLDLRGTRIAVLSACSTGRAYVPGSDGVASLARAFLAAGVPTVVASLWEVDDQITVRLLLGFHEHLRAGADPAEALQRAQVSLLAEEDESTRSPSAWGAFSVMGANTPLR